MIRVAGCACVPSEPGMSEPLFEPGATQMRLRSVVLRFLLIARMMPRAKHLNPRSWPWVELTKRGDFHPWPSVPMTRP